MAKSPDTRDPRDRAQVRDPDDVAQVKRKDATEVQVPRVSSGHSADGVENPMTDDDDILPRRVVGEQPIAREALQDAANPYQRGERQESYNASAEERDDLDGGTESLVPIEDEPRYADIMPDQIQRMAGAADNEDEVTARPGREIRPIPPDELPEG